MKKRLGESPEDYVNLYDELTKKKHRKEESLTEPMIVFSKSKGKLENPSVNPNALVSITPDSITISAMKISYSRENLEKVIDFINSITDGEAKL